MEPQVTEYELTLLKSLNQPKYLHMGQSPVSAIAACWKLANDGLVTIGDDNLVSLTAAGKKLIENARDEHGQN